MKALRWCQESLLTTIMSSGLGRCESGDMVNIMVGFHCFQDGS